MQHPLYNKVSLYLIYFVKKKQKKKTKAINGGWCDKKEVIMERCVETAEGRIGLQTKASALSPPTVHLQGNAGVTL